jgi:hypothetical protein
LVKQIGETVKHIGEPNKHTRKAAKHIGDPAKPANIEEPVSRALNEDSNVKYDTAQTQPNPEN